MSLMQQIRIEHQIQGEPDITKAVMVTWVDYDKRVKPGVRITLKGDEREWKVTNVFGTEEKSAIDNRGWDNNNYDKHESKSFKNRLK